MDYVTTLTLSQKNITFSGPVIDMKMFEFTSFDYFDHDEGEDFPYSIEQSGDSPKKLQILKR